MDRNKNQFRPQPEWRLDGCSFQAPGLEGAGGVHAPLQHQMGGLSLKPEVASRNRQRRSLAERNQARQLGIAKQPGWRGGKNTCVQTERAMSPSTKATGGPRIADRASFNRNWTFCEFARRRTRAKAMQSRQFAGACRWSRWTQPRRLSAPAGR